MLAELAAANAAFAIIKKCVENGSDLAKAGKAISDFTLNKDAVQKKAASKGSNLDGSKSDLDDYVKFCAEARRQRAEAAAEAKRLAMKRQDDILLFIYWAACITLGVFALGLFIYILMEASNV